MSLVDDQIRRYDAFLDRYQLSLEEQPVDAVAVVEQDSTRTSILKNVIRGLSITSTSRPLLKRRQLRRLITEIQTSNGSAQAENVDEEELVWLATGKATVQVYGIVLNNLLQQTIPLSDSLWYWDDVLGSYVKTSLYMLQTSPIRLFNAGKDVLRDANARYNSSMTIRDAAEQSTHSVTQAWKEFYHLVRESVRDRSLTQARSRILTPFAVSRTEARQKQEQLNRLRNQSATAVGMLSDMGLNFPQDHEQVDSWRTAIQSSATLLEALLRYSAEIEPDFENRVYEVIDAEDHANSQPSQIVTRLLHIIDKHFPEQEQSLTAMAAEFGKPPRWVRYWIPGVILFLSGGTLLRIFANRSAEVTIWIRELGQTTIDFWYNWVVEPSKRLIGTIRHDENTELALMSRDSLKSDRESLERMVVDFAVENPHGGTAYTEAQIADIRAKVKEGDLTPVLRAYEEDMKSPVVRAVTGNLIRTLLIQIQKTKVDVEVAMSGIDSLLKSQELLFGFVGVAPGILLSYFALQWVRGFFGGRRGLQELQRKGESVRIMRNIDRILATADPANGGMLTYKDHGLLICEAHVLRQKAGKVVPGRIQREFLEDINDLINVRAGIEKQRRALQRIQWAYSRWLK